MTPRQKKDTTSAVEGQWPLRLFGGSAKKLYATNRILGCRRGSSRDAVRLLVAPGHAVEVCALAPKEMKTEMPVHKHRQSERESDAMSVWQHPG